MTEITVYPDEDTTVDGYVSADLSAVTLRIGDTDVRLEADAKVLSKIGWAIARETTPETNDLYPAAPAYERLIGHTNQAIAYLEQSLAALAEERKPEPTEELRTPETMAGGGWFRVPPSKVWRQLGGMTFNRATGNATAYFGDDGAAVLLRMSTPYPYLPDEVMQTFDGGTR